MFPARFRFVLMVAFLILAAWLLVQKNYFFGLGLLLGFGLLLWGYYRNGSVFLAYWRLRREQFDKAEKLLKEVSRPQWLARVVKTFYYSSLGHIAFQKQEYEEARQQFETARELRPPPGNNRALVLLNLAQLAKIRGDKKQAKAYLAEAKEERMSDELKAAVEAYAKKL
jgi:tetratricopeptide (TPR) repeat protein